jgi:antirestriction protein ArdC
MAKYKKYPKTAKVDIYQVVTDKIIKSLESGVKPWSCPWDRTQVSGLPTNFSTKAAYSGINTLILWAEAAEKGYASSNWLTYKQAAAMGGNVIRGNKATQIVFYKPLEIENDSGEKEIIPMLKTFAVFNLDQIENIEKPVIAPKIESVNKPSFVDHLEAEKVIAATQVKINHVGQQAFYRPSTDEINMPPKTAFNGVNGSSDYYSTALHELVHSTSHKSRLDRSLKGSFGSSDYAFEELIAELGSAFCCADFGIFGGEYADHASYIASWLKKLNEDKKFIFKAAAAAAKAHRWIFKIGEPCDKEVKKAA